jgi:hypothetical protein
MKIGITLPYRSWKSGTFVDPDPILEMISPDPEIHNETHLPALQA